MVSDIRSFFGGVDLGRDQIVIDLTVGGIVKIVVELVQYGGFGVRGE